MTTTIGGEGAPYDVAIVGGGIVGICTALSLVERGRRVVLIDQNEPGQGASYGNAGVISPWSIVPQAMPDVWKKLPGMILRSDGPASVMPRRMLRYLPWLVRFLGAAQPDKVCRVSAAMHLLCGEAPFLYRQHLKGTGKEHLVQDSYYVHACRNPADANLNSLGNQLRADKGAEIERIEAGDLRDLEPALSPAFQAAILIKGQARAVNPGGIGTALAEKFRGQGGHIQRQRVTGLHKTAHGWRVALQGDDIATQKVAVTAGGWSVQLLKEIGYDAPLAAERGYHVMAPDADISFNHSVMDVDNYIVASSMEHGVRFSGMAEFAAPDDPPTKRRHTVMRKLAAGMAPGVNLQNAQDWMGVRPSFPDSLPVISAIPDQPGLFAAFGHSHYGLMMAPKTGQLAADLITDMKSNHDLGMYAADRF